MTWAKHSGQGSYNCSKEIAEEQLFLVLSKVYINAAPQSFVRFLSTFAQEP